MNEFLFTMWWRTLIIHIHFIRTQLLILIVVNLHIYFVNTKRVVKHRGRKWRRNEMFLDVPYILPGIVEFHENSSDITNWTWRVFISTSSLWAYFVHHKSLLIVQNQYAYLMIGTVWYDDVFNHISLQWMSEIFLVNLWITINNQDSNLVTQRLSLLYGSARLRTKPPSILVINDSLWKCIYILIFGDN